MCNSHSDFDLTAGLLELERLDPGCFCLFHVRGHQDDGAPFVSLPFGAQLNICCDQMASAFVPSPSVDLDSVPLTP